MSQEEEGDSQTLKVARDEMAGLATEALLRLLKCWSMLDLSQRLRCSKSLKFPRFALFCVWTSGMS